LSTRHLRHTHSHVHDDKLGTTKLGISIPVCSDRSVVQTTEFVRFGWVRRSPEPRGSSSWGSDSIQHCSHGKERALHTHTHTHIHTQSHTCLTTLFPGLPGWAGTGKV